MANVLPMDRRVRVVACLCDGVSIRATERLTDVNRQTIMRLGRAIGEGCGRFHDRLMRELRCSYLQLDEQWAFIHTKQGHLHPESDDAHGDAWTFLAMDIASRAHVSYLVGKRTAENANTFAKDIRARVIGRPMIAADGFKPYVNAVEEAFGTDVDFAQLVKLYTDDEPSPEEHRVRYKGAVKVSITGRPDLHRIGTSYIERGNLTTRMQQRRFTRETNGFSKDIDQHRAAVALHVCWYNLVRVHETLRVTPAMALGLTDHVWTVEELILAADAAKPEPKPPTRFKSVPDSVQMTLPGMPHLRLVKSGR